MSRDDRENFADYARGLYSVAYMDGYFPRHVADLAWQEMAGIKVEILHWHEPGSSTNSLIYSMVDRALSVTGDLGDAIYEWSNHRSLISVSNASFDYWLGKIRAGTADQGPIGKIWRSETYYAEALYDLENFRESQPYAKFPQEEFCAEYLRYYNEQTGNDLTLNDILEAGGSMMQADDFYQDHGHHLFGEDSFPEGWAPTVHVQLQLHGLKKAFEWLKNNNKLDAYLSTP